MLPILSREALSDTAFSGASSPKGRAKGVAAAKMTRQPWEMVCFSCPVFLGDFLGVRVGAEEVWSIAQLKNFDKKPLVGNGKGLFERNRYDK